MRFAMTTGVVLIAVASGSAHAETFRFPAGARATHGVPQVDIMMTVYLPPECAGRWSIDYPPGFSFRRGGPNGGNLRGNPGKGTYDVAVKIEECALRDSGYVNPPQTNRHKVIVYWDPR